MKESPLKAEVMDYDSNISAPENSCLKWENPTARDDEHNLIAAKTRAGKSSCTYTFLSKYENVYYTTLKNSDKVPAHWKGFYLSGMDISPSIAALLDVLEPLLETYKDWDGETEKPKPIMLVIDEVNKTVAKIKDKKVKDRFTSFMVEVLSLGANSGFLLSVLGQNPNVSALGMQKNDRANFGQMIFPFSTNAKNVGEAIKFVEEIKSGVNITEDMKREIKSLDGYYQLWVNGNYDVCVSKLPQFTGETVHCQNIKIKETV